MIDKMALAGIALTSPAHQIAAECLAMRLQVRCRAAEEGFSEDERCRIAGGSAQSTA